MLTSFQQAGNRLSIAKVLLLVFISFYSCCSFSATDNYVGRKVCAGCHKQENEQWMRSHHDLAMQEATDNTIRGDFNNVRFKQFGVESRFYRKDKHFMVRTDGPDGKLTEYPIKYVFGFYPLQQYLIEFPGGRLQALDIAWDSRSKEQGGQRWMHLHPEEKITHDDVLHWTGPNLNWNYMCADCHSTHLEKNYDANTHSYNTTWSELDVSCEACHGPGAKHQSWAETNSEQRRFDPDRGLNVLLRDRKEVAWNIDSKNGLPKRSKANSSHTEVEVCARCHSRRSQIADDHKPNPFMDAYIPALLTEGLYQTDGQIQDEVYVYGSFIQSKMYQHGVTCSDCHNPHSNALKQPGAQVCYQCHLPSQYATKSHHFHKESSMGSNCVECHMPASIFMRVDARHDHSFRIPRPDLSVKLGVSNACNNCHEKKSNQWAAAIVERWYRPKRKGFQQFAETFHAARKQLPEAKNSLQMLAVRSSQSAIARATAMQELQVFPDRETLSAIEKNLNSQNPMLRRSTLTALRQFDLRTQVMLAFPLLNDPVRAVRIEAISLLIKIPQGRLPEAQKKLFQRAIQETIQVQQFNAERPEAQVNLGGIYSALADKAKAMEAYARALQLQSKFVPAYVNLAQLYSSQGNEDKAEELFRKGLKAVPNSTDLAEALGLSLVRQRKNDEALMWLAKAADWAPNNVRYGYVYAVALNSQGKVDAALEQLDTIHLRFPGNSDILFALVTFNRDAKHIKEALSYLKKLQDLMPGNPQLKKLHQELSLM